jgi:cytochrome c556
VKAGVFVALLMTMLSACNRVTQAPAIQVASGAQVGLTGATHPQDVIAARQHLMDHLEDLMKPIDLLQVGQQANPDVLHANAELIEAMVLAVPHLFPPSTDLYDPKAAEPQTIALPAIWKDFDTFYSLAGASAKAAVVMAEAQGADVQRAASAQLRGSCDACHALFLRKYQPPTTQESDANFDFDSAL